MAIKTDELQENNTPKLTDTLLMASSAAGTTQLSLAQAAEFFGTELVKAGNPVGAALSNKAAKSAQDTVEKTGASDRTVELAASELPAFFNALPRLLTENLTVKASGTLAAALAVSGFYGPGSIMIEGKTAGGLVIMGSITISDCSVGVHLHFVDITAGSEAAEAVSLSRSFYAFLNGCQITGNHACKGVLATSGTKAYLLECGIKNCQTAAQTDSTSIMALSNEASSAGGFSGNTVGARVYRGGVILLAESTPELLGGAANAKSGGLIAKNGSLL